MSPGLGQGPAAKSASTVWLLDDDPSVLKATGRLLASADWEVETFIDPDAFLRHAEIHHPRVAVIDMECRVWTVWRSKGDLVGFHLRPGSLS